jgi:hypothetical protein
MLRRAPSRVANASRNAQAGRGRRRRWAPARDALWDFLAPVLDEGARVAVVGAGNGDDLPLRRIAARAGAVALIDIDPRAAEGARRRLGRRERRKVEAIGHDITAGAADRIAVTALCATDPSSPVDDQSATGAADAVVWTALDPTASPASAVDLSKPASSAVDLSKAMRYSGRPRSEAPGDLLPGAPYDLVIGDLFYSQLLYPALRDLGVDGERIDATIAAHAPSLTRAAVERLHASAPLVVHVHDPLAWWDGHEQPVSLDEILDLAEADGPEAALALVALGSGPYESDPRAALAALGLSPAATALWRWPFAAGVDYLACATRQTSASLLPPAPVTDSR